MQLVFEQIRTGGDRNFGYLLGDRDAQKGVLILDTFPNDTTVWPGHDYGVRPSSTLALEKRTNPFLLCENLEAFLKLKRDWPAFKAQHGLK